MAKGGSVREMHRFSVEFQRPDGSEHGGFGGWKPKLTYIDYVVGEDDSRTVITVDLVSLTSLLNDHGFWSRSAVESQENAGDALKLVASLFDLTDKDISLMRRRREDGTVESALQFSTPSEDWFGDDGGEPPEDP